LTTKSTNNFLIHFFVSFIFFVDIYGAKHEGRRFKLVRCLLKLLPTMNIPDYRIEPADYRSDYDDIRTVREAVFVTEQNIPAEEEFDTLDAQCRHVLARDAEHRPIGTARLTPDYRIGRIAVLPEWRKQGVGKALLLDLIDKAHKLGATEVHINAQLAVLSWYEKFGFSRYGDTFTEGGIPHQAMRLALQPAITAPRPVAKPRAASVEAVSIDTLQDNTAAAIQLIAQARRRLCIYSRDLEFGLYGKSEIMEALKRFAIHSRDGGALIIVQDTIAVRSRPHPLLELAQRLPSSIQFRTPVEEEDLQNPAAFLVNDRDGYLFRLLGSRYQGDWSPVLPKRNRQLAEEFERVWQRSRPCTEFRALGI
jgi:predicted GNAT family N-acyltransferase